MTSKLYSIEASVLCHACRLPAPVNGPTQELTCDYCDAKLQLGRKYWKNLAGVGGGGNKGGLANIVTGERLIWRAAGEAEASAQIQGPPGWLKAIAPKVIGLVDAELPGAPDAAPALVGVDPTKPVLFQCPQCAGSLAITTASDRIATCAYCEVQVFLPEALWRRLHPVRTVRKWRVVTRG